MRNTGKLTPKQWRALLSTDGRTALSPTIYQFRGICLVVEAGICFVIGREVLLRPLECYLLEALMLRPGTFVSREQILEHSEERQGTEYQVFQRTIDVMLMKLRRKLFPNDSELAKLVIRTQYGVGYGIFAIK